jgi:hypothetical protein
MRRTTYDPKRGMQYHGADDEGLLGYLYGSTSSDGQYLTPDDGGVRQRAALSRSHIDDDAQQRGRAAGFFGAGGNNSGNRTNFGGSDEMVGAGGIDAPARRRNWGPNDAIRGRGNPTGPIEHNSPVSRHPIQPRPGYYAAGTRQYDH